MSSPALAKKITLPLLTFYGLGTIIGAGIYVLIGEVILRASYFAPISFVISAGVAAITGYSFARLSSMFPKSAGPAAYTQEAFKLNYVSILTGFAVILVGSVSAATMVKGFSGYLLTLIDLPSSLSILIIIGLITLVSIWGISESLMIAAVITVIEVCGILFIIFLVVEPNQPINTEFYNKENLLDYSLPIMYAAFLAFYAYIGFEDIVNIAEETIEPKRVLPLAILLSLVISTLLYIGLSLACALFIPTSIFSQSDAPLVAVSVYKNFNPVWIAIVSLIAILNGALVQLIMASRVLYGMASQNLLPNIFAKIHPRTQTPIFSTLIITLIVLILSSTLHLIQLAEITSVITLIIFIAVHASLLTLSFSSHNFHILDRILPSLGIFLNLGLIIFGFWQPLSH